MNSVEDRTQLKFIPSPLTPFRHYFASRLIRRRYIFSSSSNQGTRVKEERFAGVARRILRMREWEGIILEMLVMVRLEDTKRLSIRRRLKERESGQSIARLEERQLICGVLVERCDESRLDWVGI